MGGRRNDNDASSTSSFLPSSLSSFLHFYLFICLLLFSFLTFSPTISREYCSKHFFRTCFVKVSLSLSSYFKLPHSEHYFPFSSSSELSIAHSSSPSFPPPRLLTWSLSTLFGCNPVHNIHTASLAQLPNIYPIFFFSSQFSGSFSTFSVIKNLNVLFDLRHCYIHQRGI